MYQVKVIEKGTKEVLETLVVPLNVASAIKSGYAGDSFYKVTVTKI